IEIKHSIGEKRGRERRTFERDKFLAFTAPVSKQFWHGKTRPIARALSHAARLKPAHRREYRKHDRGGKNEMAPQLLPRYDAGNCRADRQRALEMVGQIPEIR